MLIIVLNLNLGHGFIRFASSYSKKEKYKTYSSVLIFQLLLTLAVVLVLFPFRSEITSFLVGFKSDLIYLFTTLLILATIILDSLQRYLLVQGKEMQMIRQNLFRIVFDVFFTLIGVIIRKDILGALVGFLFSKIFCVVVFSLINNINYRRFTFSPSLIKKLLKFSLPLLSISIAFWVINFSNRYLINFFIGLDAVALFSVANKFPMMLVVLFTLLSTVFLSNVSRLFDEGQYERVSYWFSIIIRGFFFLGFSGGAFLIVASKPLTLLVSSSDYLFSGLSMVYLFVAIGSLSFGGFQIISRLYDLEKKVLKNSFNWMLAMVMNIALNLILIPINGIIGAAMATGITFFVGFLISIIRRPKQIEINIPWLKMIIYGFVSLLGAYIFTLSPIFENHSVVSEFIFAIVIAIMTLCLGLVIKVIKVKEIFELIRE